MSALIRCLSCASALFRARVGECSSLLVSWTDRRSSTSSGGGAFGQLAHGVFQNLTAGAFAFLAQGADQRYALAALLP